MSTDIPSPPGGTGIRVVQSTDELLAIEIPQGGKGARGLGIFSFFWNLFTIPLSAVFFLGDDGWENGPPPFLFLLLFFSVFWAVGLGTAYAALKMRFTHTLLAVKLHELTLQRKFLGRKKLARTKLDDNSRASLDVAFQVNDQDVYRVCVAGVDREEKFGTRLTQAEKDWLVNVLNRIICPDYAEAASASGWPDHCSDCGTQLLTGEDKRVCPDCGRIYREGDVPDNPHAPGARPVAVNTLEVESVPVIAPNELSPESKIVVETDEPGRLQFWYPIDHIAIKWVGRLMMAFSVLWLSVVTFMLVSALLAENRNHDDILVSVVLAAVFGLIGLVPLLISVGLFRARVMFDLDGKNFSGKLRAGPVKFRKSISTESIRNVGLGYTGSSMPSELRTKRTQMGQKVGQSGQKVGVVYSPEFNMPVTLSTDRQLSLHVTGLVKYQLERMGYDFADE